MPRTCGGPLDGPTLFSGSYPVAGDVGDRLLCALPPVLHLPAADSPRPVLDLVAEEITIDQPGQQVVLDRLLDLLLVRTLRAWFTRQGTESPAWYRTLGKPVAGAALRALHHEPARPWTVADLAATTGISRAALARRFTSLVGEPPHDLPH
uniref:cupin domain-containing protein n=1 Tax=Kitasatospora kifunensis TaxID=58351 RepID=UPI0035E42C02